MTCFAHVDIDFDVAMVIFLSRLAASTYFILWPRLTLSPRTQQPGAVPSQYIAVALYHLIFLVPTPLPDLGAPVFAVQVEEVLFHWLLVM